MKRAMLAVVLVIGVASTAGAADVINGCYKKVNGQLRILVPPKKCLPSESPVSFLSATAAQYLNPLVYDANDQFLGLGQAGELYIPSLRKWAALNLGDTFGDIWSGQLYFESDDCTGQPYAEYEYLHRVFGIGQPGARRYFSAAPELAANLQIGSSADGLGSCQVIDFELQAVLSKAVPVVLPFAVPVAMPTKIVNP